MEAQEQGFQDGEPDIAEDAIPAASGLCATFQALGKGEDAGALVAIERPAMLARIGNKPRAAAKAISHGYFLPSVAARSWRQASRQRSQKWLAMLGENQARKELPRSFRSRRFSLVPQARFRAGFCV